jgi:hypothetical protein
LRCLGGKAAPGVLCSSVQVTPAASPRHPTCRKGLPAMLIVRRPDIRSSEITDEQLYLRRREFMRLAGGAALAAAGPLAAACGAEGLVAAGGGAAQTALAGNKPKVVTTDDKWNSF